MLAAEQTLELDQVRRKRTILRVDAGGGSLKDVNWALEQDYHIHCKDYSGVRAQTLAESVIEWMGDPRMPGSQVGWVTLAPSQYLRPVRRVAVRCRKRNGQWGVGVIISTLSPSDVLLLTGQPLSHINDPLEIRLIAAGVALCGSAFAAGAAVAGFHVGVEQHWWEGLSTCGSNLDPNLDFADFKRQLLAAPVVRCDDIAWSMFGISMAGYNIFASVVFAGASWFTARQLLRSSNA